MKYPLAIAILISFVLPRYALAAKPVEEEKEIRQAQKALALGDYSSAYASYRKVQKHNSLAQFVIGLFHQNGWGRPADPATACTWFEKAAQKYVPAAEHQWGECLAQGIGRPADIPAALVLYNQAASHGHLISWCTAADYYIQGKGVDKDVAKGIDLCTRVAQAGSMPAILKLARYFQEGISVPQDLATARHWYQEAAQRGVREAQYHFGLMLAQGEGGEPDQDAALFWMESAAAAGYVPAYLPIAVLYANQPLQPETAALAPEHLAKIYLWLAAAKAAGLDPAQQALAERMDTLLSTVMPSAWRPRLDTQVAEHLAKHHP